MLSIAIIEISYNLDTMYIIGYLFLVARWSGRCMIAYSWVSWDSVSDRLIFAPCSSSIWATSIFPATEGNQNREYQYLAIFHYSIIKVFLSLSPSQYRDTMLDVMEWLSILVEYMFHQLELLWLLNISLSLVSYCGWYYCSDYCYYYYYYCYSRYCMLHVVAIHSRRFVEYYFDFLDSIWLY